MQAPKGTKVLQAGGRVPQVNPALPPRGGGGPPPHQSPPLQGGPGAQVTCFTITKLHILTPEELRACQEEAKGAWDRAGKEVEE